MDKKLYASHIKNCLDQEKIWKEFTTGKLPEESEADKIIEERIELVEKRTGVRPYYIEVSDFKRYPSALDLLKSRPTVFEYTGGPHFDWDPSILNSLFDHSHQTIFTDSQVLAESIIRKLKIKKANICCLIRETVGDELPYNGLKFYCWGKVDELLDIQVFLEPVDAVVIAGQIADIIVLRGDNFEASARLIVDLLEEEFQPQHLLAIPGNAGCYTNKLIKKYWNLCDNVEDIECALEDAKERKKGEK